MKDANPVEPNDAQATALEEDAAPGPKARKCAMPGCPTTLSVYNHGHLCFMHSNQRAAQTLTRFPYRPERHYSEK
jgi:hypothetical protein